MGKIVFMMFVNITGNMSKFFCQIDSLACLHEQNSHFPSTKMNIYLNGLPYTVGKESGEIYPPEKAWTDISDC